MSFQGSQFTPDMRKLVVNVKIFFDDYKTKIPLEKRQSSCLAANALGIGEATVKRIMAAFNNSGESGLYWDKSDSRGKPPYSINSGVESSVRSFVRSSNQNGEQITLDSIKCFLQKDLKIELKQATLWRALIRWGFEFGTGIRSAQLKESERVIIQRRQYLRVKLANRGLDGKTLRPEVYLDESYINKNHSKDSTWYFGDDGAVLGKPTGKGERLVIMNAITKDGWVPNAKLIFKASKKTGDYHSNLDWELFSKWFQDQLIVNIPEKSLIILDNATYHNVLFEGTFPKKSDSMKKLKEWLTHNETPWTDDMLKAELYSLCARLAPKPEYSLDRIASKHGHTILRTPPYHPELQPIETCWAVVKNHVASHNNCTMKKVKELLEEGFEKVTSKTTSALIRKIEKQEDSYWKEDSKVLEEAPVT